MVFSEKGTKFEKNLSYFLTSIVVNGARVKKYGRFFSNCVAFVDNIEFTLENNFIDIFLVSSILEIMSK